MLEEMVSVPRRLLEELAGYLGDKAEVIAVPGNGEWTKTMVEQLKQEIAPYTGALAVAELAARSAGQLITLDEVVTGSSLPKKQISSDLGAMSKASRRLFSRVIWPFRALQTGTGTNYLMSPEMAEWWLA